MKLMVLDGNSIVNRAYYGVRPLTTRDGLYTNAVFGFLNILTKLIDDERPDALCVTFDLKGPTFRHLQYEDYKAQRKGMPDELAMQMPVLKEVLEAMNIPRYELSGYEADDLIGTIAKKCENAGWQCLVVTGDKDSFQLITDKTHIRHVKSRMGRTETTEYDEAVFNEEYGFEPIKMIDLKALMGDASDNIPGVSGIGEKTALDLIRRFGTVKDIYDNLDTIDIKDSVRKKLAAGKEQADMSYELATIVTDAPLEFSLEDNKVCAVNNDKLYELFKRLEFVRLTEKFGLTPPAEQAAESVDSRKEYRKEETSSSVEIIAAVEKADCVFIAFDEDMETVCVSCGDTVYVLRKGETEGYEDILSVLFSEKVKKGGYDVKDEIKRLLNKGYSADGWIFDAAVAAYLIEPTDSNYDLAKIVYRYCGYDLKNVGEDEEGQLSLLNEVDPADELYGKVTAISDLYDALMPKLVDIGAEKVLSEIEMPLCAVLAKMEREGIFVDKNALHDFGETLQTGIDALEAEIYELAGEKFNINSPKQLGTVLFEHLMLPAPKKTKTGWSTNIDVLEKLKNKHPIINKIIDYRQLAKLKSTYADGLMKFIDPDGRIRTTFQMTVTATGRLSSTDPNLQNIPVRSELGGEIRKMFVASEGKVLVDADYSQIELRLLAHISGDDTMKNAFLTGEDIHSVTASQVFGVPASEVTGLMRSRAKAVNFGIVYGISQFSLSQDIGVTVAEAKKYMDTYLEKYHGVRDYMKNIVVKAGEDGYVSTLYGRRRNLPELKASNHNVRAFGERVALNMPIQGTAADIMKLAMIRVDRRLEKEKLEAKLLLQIHDELIVECPENETEEVKRILCEEMEAAASLSVPLTADAGAGKSWFEAK